MVQKIHEMNFRAAYLALVAQARFSLGLIKSYL